MKKLRFVLLFNGKTLERWHLQCLDHLEPVAHLAAVIVVPDPLPSTSSEADSILMRTYARRVRNSSCLDVTKRFEGIRKLPPEGIGDSTVPAAFDFILKLGRATAAPTTIPFMAPNGLWYFEHESANDLQPFFREVYDSESVTHAALLSLGTLPGAEVILEEGYLRTELRSYSRHRDQVLDAIARWPARVCRRISANALSESHPIKPHPTSTQNRKHRGPHLLRHAAKITRRRLESAWQRLFRHPQWNIGVLNVPLQQLLAGAYEDGHIQWFPLRGRDSFLADPFGVVRDGRLHVFCEHFGYRETSGHIQTLDYSAAGFSQPQPAITQPVHMSYPFLVRHGDQIYCVPETSGVQEVALFRAEEFPDRWSKVAVLIDQFAGVDPTVFRHDGRWWLMCTEKGSREDAELWVWHASDLFGPWIEHTRNPVKTDVRGARPGGVPFVHNGALYRPAQDCSKRYGWRIVIQRITCLTPTDFVEEPASIVAASATSPFPLGRHTLTPVGDVVLIDGHREIFSWPALFSFLRICGRDFWSSFTL